MKLCCGQAQDTSKENQDLAKILCEQVQFVHVLCMAPGFSQVCDMKVLCEYHTARPSGAIGNILKHLAHCGMEVTGRPHLVSM